MVKGKNEKVKGKMSLAIFTEQENDGRWIAEVPSLNGVLTYGGTREDAIEKVKELALRVIDDRIEYGESLPTHTKKKEFVVKENGFHPIKAERLLNSLLRSGWKIKRETEFYKILSREGFPDFVFGFDEEEEIKERIFSKITRKNGVVPKDL